MRVGLLADSHDRIPAIAELCRRLSAAGAELILHAGDFCSPFSLGPYLDGSYPLGGVFGRNDGDREGLRAHAAKGVGIELYESPHSFEVAGTRLLLVHDIGEVHERSVSGHAVVVHGHSHRHELTERDGTLIVNPGEACGWLYGVPTAAVVDLETKAVEFIKLDEPHWKF